MDEVNQLCKMSYKTRLIGFVACCGVGILISFLVRARVRVCVRSPFPSPS